MRTFLFMVVALASTNVFGQAAETATNDLSKVTTGLSIGLIIMTALVAYLMFQREKLLKRNKELSDKLHHMERNSG